MHRCVETGVPLSPSPISVQQCRHGVKQIKDGDLQQFGKNDTENVVDRAASDSARLVSLAIFWMCFLIVSRAFHPYHEVLGND